MGMKLLEFEKFENDLHKIYLFSHSDKFSFSHIDSLVRSVSHKIFQMLTPPGIFPESIDKSIPVFNYGNKPELTELLRSGAILKEKVYNLPEFLINANSKVQFHKLMNTYDFVPKTVFSKEDAADLNFPVIAKTDRGSKGEGVKVVKSKEELSSLGDEFQVYSEKFDLDKEFRAISIKGKIVFIAERIPINDKANSLREGEDIFDRKGSLDDRSSYDWRTVNMGENGIPKKELFEMLCSQVNNALHLEFLGVDIGIDKNGKMFCIEANTCPGLNRDQIICIYEAIFEDFYKRKPNAEAQKQLDQLRAELVRANEDPVKFSHSPHMGRKFYYYKRAENPDTGKPAGDTSVYSVKFDLEKSFGKPLKDIKKDNSVKEGRIMKFDDFKKL